MKYVEMYIDEMKKAKEGLQIAIGEFQNKLNYIKCIEETKENRWELVQLEEHYTNCIKVLIRVVKKYSNMIKNAEMDELTEEDFKDMIKEIQRTHAQVVRECERKSIQRLEKLYFENNLAIQTSSIN